MELRQLEALDAVLETGSFSAAARRRHLSQPALWAQVRALEGELGVRLFVRRGRGVTPTAACLALRARVRTVLDDASRLAQLSREIREGREAPARIGCAQYHVPFFLADAIARLLRERPDAPFPTVVPVTSSDATERLVRGELDLVVQPAIATDTLESAALYPVWLAAVGPLVRGPTLDVRALDAQPVATFPPDSGVRQALEGACRAARISLRVLHQDRDAASLLALAERGLCTAIVISEAVPAALARKAAKLARGATPFASHLHLRWRSEESLSPASRALRDAMLAEARERSRRRRS